MNTKSSAMDKFLAKIESLKKGAGADLSTAEDLSLAVMNLVSLEEHFFFTGIKTKHAEYFDTSLEIRDLRKELLKELMPNHEGETWCVSKHLLAATMRLMEVGNKLQSEGRKDQAGKMFEKAYKIYSIFWALKLKLVGVRKIDPPVGREAASISQLEELIAKLADCCDE